MQPRTYGGKHGSRLEETNTLPPTQDLWCCCCLTFLWVGGGVGGRGRSVDATATKARVYHPWVQLDSGMRCNKIHQVPRKIGGQENEGGANVMHAPKPLLWRLPSMAAAACDSSRVSHHCRRALLVGVMVVVVWFRVSGEKPLIITVTKELRDYALTRAAEQQSSSTSSSTSSSSISSNSSRRSRSTHARGNHRNQARARADAMEAKRCVRSLAHPPRPQIACPPAMNEAAEDHRRDPQSRAELVACGGVEMHTATAHRVPTPTLLTNPRHCAWFWMHQTWR
jgi:hypothetical protein